jgi:hypothetical protein
MKLATTLLTAVVLFLSTSASAQTPSERVGHTEHLVSLFIAMTKGYSDGVGSGFYDNPDFSKNTEDCLSEDQQDAIISLIASGIRMWYSHDDFTKTEMF